MLDCEKAPYHRWEIGRRLCVEYVDICDDRLWKDFTGVLLPLIRMKMQKTVETVFGLTKVEVSLALTFWELVKKTFLRMKVLQVHTRGLHGGKRCIH